MIEVSVHSGVLALAAILALAAGGLGGYVLRGWVDMRRRARRQQQLAEIREQAPAEERRYRNTARPAGSPGWSLIQEVPYRSGTGSPAQAGGAGRPATPPAPTVLVVDDRLELLALHASYLERAGYNVLTAEDGDAALAMARRHHPAVLVLDHSMPKRTGIEVARELKSNPATADIAILLMTAHSYGAIGTTAMKAGCDAFLPKPCDPARVLKEVMRHAPRTGLAGV